MSLETISIDLNQVDTAPTATLGQYFVDQIGNMYRYVKGGGTVAQYEYVFITSDGTFTASQLTTTNVASAKLALIGCVQQSAGLTSSTYGWVLVRGAHTGKFAASYVANSKTYVTAVAGVVDDAATTLIAGLTGLSATVGASSISAYAYVEMYASGQ